MALRRRLLSSLLLQQRRLFSSSETKTLIAGGDKDKTRSALSLIRFEQNPDRILEICRSAALSPESHLDRIVSAKAISKLKQLNHYDAIRAFIEDSINQSERHASHCIILYGKAGLIGDAVKLFDEMPKRGIDRNVKTLNSLLFSCLLAREYSEMKRIFSEFPKKYGLNPSLETYNIILRGLCSSGEAKESHSILAEMANNAIKPNGTTFAITIAGLYAEEDFTGVGKVMHSMKQCKIRVGIGIYNVRISSLCKLGRVSEAKALFDGILGTGMKPNSQTYGHLIYGLCRKGRVEMAKNLFLEMVERGLKPEAECYFTLVYYLCEEEDFEAALSVCEDCMSNGWVPNFTTMRMLVRGLAAGEKVDEARGLIRRLKKRFQRNGDVWDEIEKGLPLQNKG